LEAASWMPYWNPQNLVGNSRPFFKWPAKIAYQIQRDAEVYAYGSTYTNNVDKIQNTIVATGACGQWVEYAGGTVPGDESHSSGSESVT
jgi:hypothetical protein